MPFAALPRLTPAGGLHFYKVKFIVNQAFAMVFFFQGKHRVNNFKIPFPIGIHTIPESSMHNCIVVRGTAFDLLRLGYILNN